MKTILTVLFTGILLLCTTAIRAQEWTKLDPKMTKLLVDTNILRAYEVTMAPGEKSKMHTHPAEFFYALTDAKINVHYADGKVEVYELKAGESGYSNGERPHWTENIGTTTARWVEVELKEHPYKKAKTKK